RGGGGDSDPQLAIPDVTARRGGGGFVSRWLPLALSGLAFPPAAAALALTWVRDPPGAGLQKHDFATPPAALPSQTRTAADTDRRAMIELERHVRGKKKKEKLDTLQVKKEVDHRNYKLLFVTYKQEGADQYAVEAFEKDAETGFWLPRYLGRFEIE